MSYPYLPLCFLHTSCTEERKHLVASGHMGGHFAAELKYAGYDAVIVEGRTDRPVWLSIADGKVELRDGRHLWGQGICRATYEISLEMGPEAAVACIGPAGENQVPMSVIINPVSHSAGGGATLGAKNLKAVAVRGTGSIRIAASRDAWEKAVKYHLSLLGANNQHVVPDSPQPWSEFSSPGSRWVASKGRLWGAANPAIDTVPDWIFEYGKDQVPFSAGTIRMDREDIRLAMELFYREMGWETKTGAPSCDTYRKFGLESVAKELQKKDLAT